jgi:hypothetical protein
MSSMRLSLLRGATCVLVGSISCRATDDASRSPLAAAVVAGCYQFTYADGRAIPSPSGFWAAPVRLDTALALLDGDGGYRTEPGIFAVVPTGAIVPAEAMDTAFIRSTWRVLPPDTLLVLRSTGLVGQTLRVRARGLDFAGRERWEYDVVDRAHPPREEPVVARRVSCSTPAG